MSLGDVRIFPRALVVYKTPPLDPKLLDLLRPLGAGVPLPCTEDFLCDLLSMYKPM